MRRKFLCLLLLSCLAAPVLVVYGWLQYQQTMVRKEVKRQIIAGKDDSELVLLKFTPEESKTKLRWKHSREFEYQGQMYDIVRTIPKKDTISYYCWWDREESGLNQQIRQLVANALEKSPSNQESKERLTQFFKSLYFFEMPSWPVIAPIAETNQVVFSRQLFLPPALIPPLVPPPELS